MHQKIDLRSQKHRESPILDIHAHPFDGDAAGARLLVSQQDGFAAIYTIGDRSSSVRLPPSMIKVSYKPVLSGRFNPVVRTMFAASAQDQVLRIFDTRIAGRDACVTKIRPGTSVGCVRWRPERPEQVATTGCPSELDTTSRGFINAGILVWDLRRPFFPVHQFGSHADVHPDFFWADTNSIVACTRDSTVQLYSAMSSHQPLRAMRCAGVSWSLSSSGVEKLAIVADEVQREVEYDPNQTSALELLKANMDFAGFPEDVGPQVDAEPLSDKTEWARLCHLFERVRDSHAAEDEAGLRQLINLAQQLQPPSEGETTQEICERQARRCDAEGLRARAETWRLLVEIVGGEDPPSEVLLAGLVPAELPIPSVEVGLPGLDPEPPSSPQVVDGAAPRCRGAGARLTGDGLSPSSTGELLGVSDGLRRLDSRAWSGFSLEPAISDDLPGENRVQWRRAWRIELVRSIVAFHEEKNDVGMLLSLVVALGMDPDPDTRAKRRVFRWVQGATELLQRMQQYVPRAELYRALPLPEVQALAQRSPPLCLRCAHCKQVVEPTAGFAAARRGARRLAGPSGVATGVAAPRGKGRGGRICCSSCQRPRTPPCTVCGEEVRGLWVGCQVCGHGGHLNHIRAWFAEGNTRCPGGCGHVCTPPGRPAARQSSGFRRPMPHLTC